MSEETTKRTAGLGTRIHEDVHTRMKAYCEENGVSLASLIEESAKHYMRLGPVSGAASSVEKYFFGVIRASNADIFEYEDDPEEIQRRIGRWRQTARYVISQIYQMDDDKRDAIVQAALLFRQAEFLDAEFARYVDEFIEQTTFNPAYKCLRDSLSSKFKDEAQALRKQAVATLDSHQDFWEELLDNCWQEGKGKDL